MRTTIGVLLSSGLALALAGSTHAQDGRGAPARQQPPQQQQPRMQPPQQPPRAAPPQVPATRQRAKAEAGQQATRTQPGATATKVQANPRAQRMALLRAEMIRTNNDHVDRQARLERMRQLAQSNEQALQKVKELQAKQYRLHQERIRNIETQRGQAQKDG